MTQLNLENSSQAIQIKNQAKNSPNLKNQSIKKLILGNQAHKKYISDLGNLSKKCQGELSGN